MNDASTFRAEQWLPYPRPTVFRFFSDAYNLENLTPPWLRFVVLTPRPIVMRTGLLIDYQLKIHGVPVRWQTEITAWEPEQRFDVTKDPACTSYCRGLFWIVPAKVEGTWKAGASEITFSQTFQMVSGTVKTGNVIAPISAGRITGDSITFTAGGTTYTAKIDGSKMTGTAGTEKFEATKG